MSLCPHCGGEHPRSWWCESGTYDPVTKPAEPVRATDICAKAAELVGGERDRMHGSKRRNFENIGRIWTAYLANRSDPRAPLRGDEVGDMMELLKVARRQHGAYNPDDYVDGAGYAGCAGEIAAQIADGHAAHLPS